MYYLGVDLGGTNIAAGVADESYQLIAKTSRKTHIPCSNEEICEQLAGSVKETLEKAGLTLNDIPYIGVGSPGTVNRETGVIEYANNLKFKHLPLQNLLEEKLNKKVILENDANAAAFGEYKAGALKGAKIGVAITLGTGIGGGVIIDDKILTGSNFAGGELGHTVIEAKGRPCTCGRRGCWEAYASATGLIRSTREAMEKDRSSALWTVAHGDLNNVDGRTAFQAMREGDATAKAVVDDYIYYLACGVINIINIFQPDILCIGGGISHEGDPLMVPLKEQVAKEVYSKYSSKQTVICRAKLGNDAGILGAALLGE
ncbi:ROK family protein [Thermocaproicibacter melissae]|jgi:glucokinase|uniref:ROK family protein n=1 Tax=Thermocaproicibacter melissae TaxID=2966552 RepID=UPI0024B15793|nr:ROK family protein [Thermocaproicibacter melissae]WBY63351.1 ROK family protein [Thermocaproicibacter melissae]